MSDDARTHPIAPSCDDLPTLLATGAFVAVVASLAHELLGHGVGCLADGGSVTLVTFLVFRCLGAGVAGDGGGPIGALIVGGLAMLFFRLAGERRSAPRLFLLTLGVTTLLWVSAQMVREAWDGSDDWGHVARDLGWPPIWHAVVGAMGVAGYAGTLYLAGALARPFADGRPDRLALPYFAALVTAVPLGALWHGDPAASALDAFLTFGLAPLGYLLVIRAVARDGVDPASAPLARDWPWLVGVPIVVAAFGLTIARGIGSLS